MNSRLARPATLRKVLKGCWRDISGTLSPPPWALSPHIPFASTRHTNPRVAAAASTDSFPSSTPCARLTLSSDVCCSLCREKNESERSQATYVCRRVWTRRRHEKAGEALVVFGACTGRAISGTDTQRAPPSRKPGASTASTDLLVLPLSPPTALGRR